MRKVWIKIGFWNGFSLYILLENKFTNDSSLTESVIVILYVIHPCYTEGVFPEVSSNHHITCMYHFSKKAKNVHIYILEAKENKIHW